MMAETLHKRSTIWAGRGISMLVVLALLTDAAVNLLTPETIAGEVIATGFKISQTPALGTIVLICALLYAIPRTAVLGAILVTGFLGGAICTHFRLGEVFSPPQIVGLVLGALTWAGIYLRDARLRALLPVTVS
jgi:DoxX-like family